MNLLLEYFLWFGWCTTRGEGAYQLQFEYVEF